MCLYKGKSMSIDPFSNLIQKPQTTVQQVTPPAPQVQQPAPVAQAPVVTAEPKVAVDGDKKSSFIETVKKAAPIVVPLASIPVAVILAHKTSTKLVNEASDKIRSEITETIKDTVTKNQEELKTMISETAQTAKKNTNDVWKVIAAIGAGFGIGSLANGSNDVDGMSKDNNATIAAKRIQSEVASKVHNSEVALERASAAANSSANSLGKKYTQDFYGIPLLNTEDAAKNNKIYAESIKKVQSAAKTHLYEAPDIKPINKKHPTLWSITSEFAPIKEGGLGSVPVEVQDNANKLGIDMPTFVPMYHQKGVAGLSQRDGKYVYQYKDKKFDVEKAASFKVDTYQDGKSKTEEVEIFVHYPNGKPILTAEQNEKYNALLKENYSAAEIYYNAPEACEALFANQEFMAKAKEAFDAEEKKLADKDPNYKVEEFKLSNALLAEGADLLIDSHPSYKTNKKLVFIKNNTYFNGTIYQRNEKTEEPEKFAFFSKAVYELLKTKDDSRNVRDFKVYDQQAFDSIKTPDSLILNDWQASPIAALARYKAPMEYAYGQISKNFSNKIDNMNIIAIGHNAQYQGSTANDNDTVQKMQATSNILNTLFDRHAFDIVSNAKTYASNTDYSDPGLKNLDNALVMNAHDPAWSHTNLLNMGIILSDYFHPVSKNYANELISAGHEDLAGELQWALTKKNESGRLFGVINGNDFHKLSIEKKKKDIFDKTGVNFDVYRDSNDNWDLNSILSARKNNKERFYNEYMIPFTLKNTDNDSEQVKKVRELSSKLEFVDPTGTTKLPKLTAEELEQTPVISMVGRFVTQKGIDIMADAIDKLYKNWETDFPGKNKPIFYIAGSDGEGGKQREFIENLKQNKLSPEDNNRVIFAHGFAPMQAITASSDFFLMPSRFEPCGLTQGESFAVGTPVIASAVGGIVDTVNRNGKENGVLTTPNKKLDADEFYQAIKKGIDIYFNDKERYNNMLKDAYSEDFSWILPNREGPVYDYLEKIGMDKSVLPEASELEK